MADIEVESLADDLESDVTPVAEADEVPERLVDFDMFIHETDQVHLLRADERELSDHRLARPDLPGPVQLLDLPPARGSELVQDRLGHVRPSDRTVEVGQDRELGGHRGIAIRSAGVTCLRATSRGTRAAPP